MSPKIGVHINPSCGVSFYIYVLGPRRTNFNASRDAGNQIRIEKNLNLVKYEVTCHLFWFYISALLNKKNLDFAHMVANFSDTPKCAKINLSIPGARH
jgi:hypothetical protein